MVITIDGINKLVGHHFHNRTIQKITTERRFGKGSDSYVFHFPSISGPRNSTSYGTKDWVDEFEVHLYRNPDKSGKYELYVMGLASVTCQQLSWSELLKFSEFLGAMEVVIGRAKRYWVVN